jgi:hypothetical protein
VRGLRRTPWSPVYWTIAAILLLGIVVVIVGGFLASDDRDIWVEVSKAGVGIALITVAGAVASIAVKHVDEARAREAALRPDSPIWCGSLREPGFLGHNETPGR